MWTRRRVLTTGGLALVSLGVAKRGPHLLDHAAPTAPPTPPVQRRKTLVTVFLRGGMDGLMAVPPLDNAWLHRLRPRLAVPAAGRTGDTALFDLGVGFGLHPAFAPLLPLWKNRQLGIVHAVGLPEPTRSHFEAQEYLETGTPGRRGTTSGWLNRVGGLLETEPSPFRCLATGPTLPRSLHGPVPALAVTDLTQLREQYRKRQAAAAGPVGSFENLYQRVTGMLRSDALPDGFEILDLLPKLDPARYRPVRGARYPRSRLGRSLRRIALLVKAELGLEIAFAESGGWDTHVQQGTTRGIFARRASDLARSLAAFWSDLGAYRDNVVVLTVTEFGRTLGENNSHGTDHGSGSCCFLIGERVNGGKVHGTFPDLRTGTLTERHGLTVTTDSRSVLSEITRKHLGVTDLRAVFPDWSGRELPLFES